MAARKKVARKKTSPRPSSPSRRKAAKPSARKTPAKRRTTRRDAEVSVRSSPTEQLARQIIDATTAGQLPELSQLYADQCRSAEPAATPQTGLEAIRDKHERFRAQIREQHWRATRSWVSACEICIEWRAELTLLDGRHVELEEIAVHEVDCGRIVAERFYYDPAPLRLEPAPSEPPSAPSDPPRGEGEPPATADEMPVVLPDLDDGPPPIDPLDL